MMNKPRGPMRGAAMGGRPSMKNVNKNTVKRLMDYVGNYKLPFVAGGCLHHCQFGSLCCGLSLPANAD